MTCGILIVDKPEGLTSFGVVKEVRRVLGARKAGHTGTLDPMATGVLPVCLGEATKIAGLLTAGDKAYDGTAVLGLETDTLDVTGRETHRWPVSEDLSSRSVEAVLEGLRGLQRQVPPAYSAVRCGGERAYKRARRGETVELEAREVQIHRLELTSWDPPHFSLSVACSKGTYVRSLVHEIGRRLGCGATLARLRRTAAGRFGLDRAVKLEELARRRERGDLPLYSMDEALALEGIAALELTPEEATRIGQGQALTRVEPEVSEGLLRLRQGEQLVALGETREGRIWPRRVFTRGLSIR